MRVITRLACTKSHKVSALRTWTVGQRSVVWQLPPLRLGEVRNSVCRLLRVFIAQNINIVKKKNNTDGLSIMDLVGHFPC